MNANNAALRQFLAASAAFGGLAPAMLIEMAEAGYADCEDTLLHRVRDANVKAADVCKEQGNPPPVLFQVANISPDWGTGSQVVIRYGGGRTYAELALTAGDVWVYSLGVREHGRVTVESAITLAASIERRARAAAAVVVPAEPEAITVVRRSPLPEDAPAVA